MGLARSDIHPARDHGKEGTAAVNGTCATVSMSHHLRSQEGESVLTWFFVVCMQFEERWWYRHACAAGGVFNVLLMMGANLIGFVLGVDGAQYLAHEVVSNWDGKSYSGVASVHFADGRTNPGLRFLFIACSCLFVGVQVMFEYRYVRSFVIVDCH